MMHMSLIFGKIEPRDTVIMLKKTTTKIFLSLCKKSLSDFYIVIKSGISSIHLLDNSRILFDSQTTLLLYSASHYVLAMFSCHVL